MSLRINNAKSGSPLSRESEVQSISAKNKTNFKSMLTHTQNAYDKELSSFITQIDLKGKKLAESLSLEDLLEFKNMVKNFLKSTLGQSRSMQEESLWDFRGQPKIMARVTKINQALEELGNQVLQTQQEPLKILAKIDEIKGLILDLFA
ncbi:MAG: YaaR family protein [Bacillota bacterium]|jgi:uncharacterized protein YaaR (DUF327 family)